MELEDTEGWTQQCSWNSAFYLSFYLFANSQWWQAKA